MKITLNIAKGKQLAGRALPRKWKLHGTIDYFGDTGALVESSGGHFYRVSGGVMHSLPTGLVLAELVANRTFLEAADICRPLGASND